MGGAAPAALHCRLVKIAHFQTYQQLSSHDGCRRRQPRDRRRTPKREGIEQTSFEIVRLCVHLSEGHRQARIRAQAMERDLKHRGRNINADDGASRSYPVSESQRGLTATTANVENLLALGRLQRVYGRKSPGRRSGGRATRETAPRSCQLPRSSVRFVRRSPWASGFRHVNVLARKFSALRSVSYRRTL